MSTIIPSIGNGDFTVDYWIKPTTQGGYRPSIVTTANGGLWIGEYGTGNIYVLRLYNVANYIEVPRPTLNIWTHIAVTRQNNTVRMFFNGTLVGTGVMNYSITGGSTNIFSDGSTAHAQGYIDELRVSDIARWTSDFTPPTVPYSN